MTSAYATATTTTSTSATAFRPPPTPPKSPNPKPPPNLQFTPHHPNRRPISTRSLQISHPNPLTPPPQPPPPPHFPTTLTVAEKLHILITEFESLHEPIDRVKRLIHYAGLLPEFDQSSKVESNRVTGCTAQVWLQVTIDDEGLMRFRVDSDSEITKGFCYCLIWLLDGASAGDVGEIRVDDLGEMNVGILPIRASSRVNTWHNVLISMQKRTRDLIIEKYGDHSSLSLLQ